MRCFSAARGANVVVNDIGALSAALDYPGVASAEAVAEEIRALGGRAVADTHSVADADGGEALVETALSAFGSCDILVNNAGICRVVSFDDMTGEDFDQVVEENLMGTVRCCRAAWPHIKARGYGRIVNVASGSMTGLPWQTAYAAAKGAIFSFTRGLASDGAEHGIKANTLVPGALTRMVYAVQEAELRRSSPAPATAWRQSSSRPPSPFSPMKAYPSPARRSNRWAATSAASIWRERPDSATRQ